MLSVIILAEMCYLVRSFLIIWCLSKMRHESLFAEWSGKGILICWPLVKNDKGLKVSNVCVCVYVYLFFFFLDNQLLKRG